MRRMQTKEGNAIVAPSRFRKQKGQHEFFRPRYCNPPQQALFPFIVKISVSFSIVVDKKITVKKWDLIFGFSNLMPLAKISMPEIMWCSIKGT